DFHTYFVGEEDWRFSVWAHNAYQINDQKYQDGYEAIFGKKKGSDGTTTRSKKRLLTEAQEQSLAARYRDCLEGGTEMDWGKLSRRQKSYVKDLAYELYGVEAATGPRRGDGAAHNAKIQEIANAINASGHGRVVAGGRLGIGERVIDTPNGFLNKRRPDII